jgi:hypothetical protein
MGYVTHTTTETIGDASVSTSVHFEEFKEFLEWENLHEVEEIPMVENKINITKIQE